ncbi:MAG TPA: methyltransferase domain-containing protein [Mycobacteriales bacterium]
MSRLESDYYAFMGYDGDYSRKVLSHYTQFFPAGPVLELACGRGEFLDLLRDAGIPVRGVDIDEGMVERAVGRGHQVELGDAIGYLEKVEPGSLGGVFCAHFLEHLEPADVARVYTAAAAALRPGAAFVAAVPSAASLSVLGHDYWRDPTHVRFYDPMLLAFFASQAGLSATESGGNPRNDPGPPPPLVPMTFEPVPALTESLAQLSQAVTAVYPAMDSSRSPDNGHRWRRREHAADTPARPDEAPALVADPRAELWSHLVHLVSVLDERAQSLQHQLGELHRAYRALLAQLYPPSEVYVVAVAPDGSGDGDR